MDDPQNKQHTDVVGQAPVAPFPAAQFTQQSSSSLEPVSSDSSQAQLGQGEQSNSSVQQMQQLASDPASVAQHLSTPTASDVDGNAMSPQAIPQPPSPTGSLAKEHMPLSTPELVPSEHTEQHIELPQELKEAGVEQVPQTEHPQLTVEDKRAGLEPAKAAVPVAQTSGDNVQLPYTEEQALQGVKNNPVGSSIRWLFESVLYQLKKAHANITKKT